MDNPVRDAQSLLDHSRSALRNAGVLFRVPRGATSSEVRKAGGWSWLVGLNVPIAWLAEALLKP